ncbi:MAG: deoxyribonuclease IV [Thermodesulfobacteriota bacterium]
MSTKDRKTPLILGAHLSIARGIHRALHDAAELGCGALQVFTKNAGTWREKDITDKQAAAFAAAMEETGIKEVFSHCAYLINLAGNDEEKTAMSVEALYREVLRCEKLGIPFVVLHPGSHMGDGEEKGIRRIAANLDRVMERIGKGKTMVLLETTAGQGSALGCTFEQLAAMRDRSNCGDRIGFCMDTCHIFAAGYDISDEKSYNRTMAAFDNAIGLSHLYLLHLNDIKKPCGSRVDRHTHIGEGYIGDAGFRLVVNDSRLSAIPMIIETPKEKEGQNADKMNLDRLRTLYG